ncbi:hypothetical protein OG402_33815 [Streptomyces anulatus]|uniref:hypothetical protein n=1 Tax=Streptomyces anulatus TaxID=1892 RepID=UPI00224DBB3F|nr:hypothetical protein [Streptomyces anulatus]MCX4605446.1 hypothetical protein [Streptomyces anulatus]
MPMQLPPVPTDIPVLVESSFSANYGPEHHGVDVAAQWWCEATRRPRRGDAVAAVSAPGAGQARPLLQLTLNADDLDEAEAVGHYAIRIARPLTRLVADGDDGAALGELKGLLSSAGPLGGGSSAAWHRVNEWLPAARAAARVQDIPELELLGYGRPVELWTVSMVAKFLGFTGPSANGSARKQLSRWGIESQGREPGRRGESQYSADEVRAKHAARPGRGRHGATRDGGRFTEPQDN